MPPDRPSMVQYRVRSTPLSKKPPHNVNKAQGTSSESHISRQRNAFRSVFHCLTSLSPLPPASHIVHHTTTIQPPVPQKQHKTLLGLLLLLLRLLRLHSGRKGLVALLEDPLHRLPAVHALHPRVEMGEVLFQVGLRVCECKLFEGQSQSQLGRSRRYGNNLSQSLAERDHYIPASSTCTARKKDPPRSISRLQATPCSRLQSHWPSTHPQARRRPASSRRCSASLRLGWGSRGESAARR